jgi:methionyl-tRNA formyltransferase
MKITILCDSEHHPVNLWLEKWQEKHKKEHEIIICRKKEDLPGGHLLLLISCSVLITSEERGKYQQSLVIHASDLPLGRGWSPHIWDLINGKDQITLSLLEVEDLVDSGAIWKKLRVPIPSTALYDEINNILFDAEIDLMDYAIKYFHIVEPSPQSVKISPTYWRKRSPFDSEIDIHKSLAEQFNLIKVCDPKRFPAYFYKDGLKFILKIEAVDEK